MDQSYRITTECRGALNLITNLKPYTMHLIIAKVMFIIKLHTGLIIPTDDVDDRTIYSMPSQKIEYAYKEEIIRYLETGIFVYDETLEN